MFCYLDHTYSAPPPSVVAERMSSLQSSVVNLRKRKAELESKVTELEKAVVDRIDDLSDHGFHEILSKAQQIPAAIISSYASKLRKIEGQASKINYSKEIKEFAITLFSYSRKSYEYVRESMEDALPCVSTIKNWLNKVDGSPGFSHQAFQQLKHMVEEKKMLGQKVTNAPLD